MPQYRVTVTELHNQDWIVEADSADEAREAVADGQGELEGPSAYVELDTDVEQWPVRLVEQSP